MNSMLEIDLTRYLKSAYGVDFVYPTLPPSNNGVTSTPTGCSIYSNTVDEYAGESTYYIQFITAGKSQKDTQSRNLEVLNFFKDTILIGAIINEDVLIDVTLLNDVPMLIGTDAENRFRYSFNLKMLLKK